MGAMAFDDGHRKLTRQEASDAVTGLGWRYVLGELRTEVRTGSLPLAADVAARAAAVPEAQGHLLMDVRAEPGPAVPADGVARRRDRARRRTRRAGHPAAVRGLWAWRSRHPPAGPRPAVQSSRSPSTPSTSPPSGRSGRTCSATPTSPAPRTGRRARRPGRSGPGDLVPADGRARPQRNRLHFDITVPHDEAHRPRGGARGGRPPALRRLGAGVLGSGRPRGQRGLHLHLAGPGLGFRTSRTLAVELGEALHSRRSRRAEKLSG